ncbi:MAG: arginine N-succinyltransferase [Deltaproteobacteria bacterium]|nr:MAG: arginine N-succinyltransferase [Deltaproteobacteria bacterium]
MFVIRQSFQNDIDQIVAVAHHLDTMNLPADRRHIERIVATSERSFSGDLDRVEREYLFVLEDTGARRVVGTSMIHAKHGTRRAPHVFFRVVHEERYSVTLDRYFVHQCLRIGYNYDGPTEIGGLILLPDYRGRPESLGKFLSYVRFLFIAMHRDVFQDQVLSELLPPLEPDGTSALWNSLGYHFTGLSYQEADLLSKDNKEFIQALFPHELIYTSMLPERARSIIGQVGPAQRGVEKMLRRIGFEYAEQIDPFDGGPHFFADTDQITLVDNAIRGRAATSPADDAPWGIVAVEGDTGFRAACGRFSVTPGTDDVRIDDATRAALGVDLGQEVWWVAP